MKKLGLDVVSGNKALEEEYFECYAEFAKILRTWFIAYGIGAPVVILTNSGIWNMIKNSGEVRYISILFLIGVAFQVLEALLYKNTMWLLYLGEDEERALKGSFLLNIVEQISEFTLAEITIDIATFICFALATYTIITIIT